MKNVTMEQKMEWNVLQPAEKVVHIAQILVQKRLFMVQPVQNVETVSKKQVRHVTTEHKTEWNVLQPVTIHVSIALIPVKLRE